MAKKPSPYIRDHLEWLGFIQPTGLVVSAHALEQAGAILNRRDIEGQMLLMECVEERELQSGDDPELILPDFERFARRVLGWSFSPKGYAAVHSTLPPRFPAELEVHLPQYGETLRPDFAVRNLSLREGQVPWQLLVNVLDPGIDPDRIVFKRGGLETSPHGRLERLLRQTRVPAGILFNGQIIRLLSAPRGESSGWMDFRVRDMLPTAGRPLCAALRLLLGQTRLLTGPSEHRLPGLLEASRKYQNVVSERLAEQVLHGLYELLRGFQSAHQKSHSTLLAHELEQDPDNVYRALLTVILRLVFLLYAEERGLLSEDDTFLDYYSVVGLHERLREDTGLHPDTMDDRYGAWAQLLVLFRMVHDGARSGEMKLPARRGDLFNPSRFPFLEGWRGSGAALVTESINPPLVPDGTIHRVLTKLLVLDGERISYRALDVEQIGSVYETMMGFRLEKATGLSIAIKSSKKGGASTTINLEQLVRQPSANRTKWVKDRTDRKVTATVTKPVKAATSVTEMHAALAKVVDSDATPDLVPSGAMILQPSEERRRSGSHYTPRELTAPIVEETLKPILERLAADTDGTIPRASDLLKLKICDPAMGSGAFLVETCRTLAERLVESWRVHDDRPEIPPDEDELVFARRMVAQRCLFGVDRNPMAVDLAKMSLWLATLAKDEPLTFVDHALHDGDSLVGLTRRQIAAFTWKRGFFQPELGMRVDDAVEDAMAWRRLIREAGRDTTQVELEEMWEEARTALKDVRFYGDLAIEAFFLDKKAKAREQRRRAHLAAVQSDDETRDTMTHRKRLAKKRRGHPPLAPFHWEIEFPEVFERKNPGFDAFVGNPPFGGRNTLREANVTGYPDWLSNLHIQCKGHVDLVAHFFRRAFDLLRDRGTLGLIATNTIGQGDTRGAGLRFICRHGGEIYSARRRVRWPGLAAVVVSVVHVHRGTWSGGYRHLDGSTVPNVTAFLFHHGSHDDPARLTENAAKSFFGSKLLGMGFTFDDRDKKGVASPLAERKRLLSDNPANHAVIRPYIGGAEINSSPVHAHRRYTIDFGDYPLRRMEMGEFSNRRIDDLKDVPQAVGQGGIVPHEYLGPVAADWPEVLAIVEERVKPERENLKASWGPKPRHFWWHHVQPGRELQAAIADLPRVLAISRVGQHAAIAFLPTNMVYADSTIIFPLPTHAAFCTLQSRAHEFWARFFGSSMKDDLRYTPSDVFETFPFPQCWTTHPALEAAGQAYYDFRADLMVRNNEGLTKTYNRFHNPDEHDSDIVRLRELHARMDRAVLAAYGWSDIDTTCEFLLDYEIDEEEWGPRRKKPYRYRWPDPVRDEVLGRLLKLNAERAEEERRG